MNNDRLNNAQRKALVGVVSETMERKIQEAKDASGQVRTRLHKALRWNLELIRLTTKSKRWKAR